MIVVYEDNHLLVVNKPAGLLTQPSGTDQDSLEAQAKAWIKEQYQKPGNVFLGVVHRLDKPVSGIVLFARTSKALSRLNETMRNKQSKKTYLAVVEGVPNALEGTLEHYLCHDDHEARVSGAEDPDAKRACLHYRVLEKREGSALVEIELETGRYHQIRAQFSAIGHPIVGDWKYGSSQRGETIALHHWRLTVTHPITGAYHTFEAGTGYAGLEK